MTVGFFPSIISLSPGQSHPREWGRACKQWKACALVWAATCLRELLVLSRVRGRGMGRGSWQTWQEPHQERPYPLSYEMGTCTKYL